jgi:uncharacterized damage-inducible protein DinB
VDPRIFEHNNWANRRLIEACCALDDEQLDAPQPPWAWSIRETLLHFVFWQRDYLWLLTGPPDEGERGPLSFADLKESAKASGEALLALAHDADEERARLRTSDGYFVEPWVVMLQVINHAADHRRQICGMLKAIGVTPPGLDGWGFGEAEGALVPMSGEGAAQMPGPG